MFYQSQRRDSVSMFVSLEMHFTLLYFTSLRCKWVPGAEMDTGLYAFRRIEMIHGHPSNHEMFAQRWLTVGPPSTTLAQQYTNVGPASHVCWDIIH